MLVQKGGAMRIGKVFFGFAGVALVGIGVLLGMGATAKRPPRAIFDPVLMMSPQVEALVVRSCADCHSRSNELPWYAYVPPASWLVARDINKAQKAMSLSDWSRKNGRNAGTAAGTLAAMCEDVKSGRMPDRKYLWMHPDAKFNAAEVSTFCAWTSEQLTRSKLSRAPRAALR